MQADGENLRRRYQIRIQYLPTADAETIQNEGFLILETRTEQPADQTTIPLLIQIKEPFELIPSQLEIVAGSRESSSQKVIVVRRGHFDAALTPHVSDPELLEILPFDDSSQSELYEVRPKNPVASAHHLHVEFVNETTNEPVARLPVTIHPGN